MALDEPGLEGETPNKRSTSDVVSPWARTIVLVGASPGDGRSLGRPRAHIAGKPTYTNEVDRSDQPGRERMVSCA